MSERDPIEDIGRKAFSFIEEMMSMPFQMMGLKGPFYEWPEDK